MQRASIQIRCLTAPNKSLYGRSDHPNNISPREQVDLARIGNTHHMGQGEFQDLQVKVHGTKKREDNWQTTFSQGLWGKQSRARESCLTPAWETQLLSRSLGRAWRVCSPRRIGQSCLVDLKPGSTNTPFCQDSWALLYAVPITTFESLERKISSFLWKWLGLNSCIAICNAMFYQPGSKWGQKGSGRQKKQWR